jgi:hypothetical protein
MSETTALMVLVFRKATELFNRLTDEQLAALANGSGELYFSTPEVTVRTGRATRVSSSGGGSRSAKVDLDATIERLLGCADQEEAERYLAEINATIPIMKAIAEKLEVTVPSSPKARVVTSLAKSAIGYRAKFESVLGRPYER